MSNLTTHLQRAHLAIADVLAYGSDEALPLHALSSFGVAMRHLSTPEVACQFLISAVGGFQDRDGGESHELQDALLEAANACDALGCALASRA